MAKDTISTTIRTKLNNQRGKEIEKNLRQIEDAVAIVARLRGPGGCPWDREQTHLSLRQYLIEEAHEVLDVLDRCRKNGNFSKKDQKLLCEELGDLLLQILLHSELTHERGEFDFGDVCRAMCEKLVYRHPHVFGDTKVSGTDEVLQNWEALKKKQSRKKNVLEGIPKNLPALQKAARMGEKAKNVGFDWENPKQVWKKVEEEIDELDEAMSSKNKEEIEHELGDVLFSVSQLARHLKIQPEDALRKANARFEQRFSALEEDFAKKKKKMTESSIVELEAGWQAIKRRLAKR